MEAPADTNHTRSDHARDWPYRTYMAAIIGMAAAWPWSAVLVPTIWPRFFYLMTGFVLVLVLGSYAAKFGEKLRSRPSVATPHDETALSEVPPRGIDPTLDLASLMYDGDGKITLPRVALTAHLGSWLAALNLLVPSDLLLPPVVSL